MGQVNNFEHLGAIISNNVDFKVMVMKMKMLTALKTNLTITESKLKYTF